MSGKRKGTRIGIYILCLIGLYAVIKLVPGVGEALTGTEIVQFGQLHIEEEETIYIVRDETVYKAASSCDIKYKVKEGTQVQKGEKLCEFTDSKEGKDDKKVNTKYTRKVENLKNHIQEDEGGVSLRKGVFSFTVDGLEDYFSVENMENLEEKETRRLDIDPRDINRESAKKGEPIYKIADNSNWYMVFWVESGMISRYEKGNELAVRIGEEEIPATVHTVAEAEDGWRIILRSNRAWSGFATARVVQGQVITTQSEGLIVSNECLTTKDGVVGVYKRLPTGEYTFVPVNVKASNGQQSSLSEGTFYDGDGNIVRTIEVYDELLTNPDTEEPSKNKEKDGKDKENNQEDGN